MIPGLTRGAEERLAGILDPSITAVTATTLQSANFAIFSPQDPELHALGVEAVGSADLSVVVTDPHRPVGQVRIEAKGSGCLLFLDNRAAEGNLHANIRMLGDNSSALFHGLTDGYIALHQLFMRSAGQMLFWGPGATAVGCSIEMEGDDRHVAIGDDALISSGVWIRNDEMHAIHDMRTGARINRPSVDTVLERHVWIGQNALLLSCRRVGAGSIVGAQSLVKGVIGPCVAIGGVPARVIRSEVSWGRLAAGMTEAERAMLEGVPVD